MGDCLGRGRADTGSRASASQSPASTPSNAAAATAPPAGTAQNPQARRRPAGDRSGTVGHAIPTPGIGEPDGRKGIQEQVTPIGQEAVGFHNNWLLPLCAIISIFVWSCLCRAWSAFVAAPIRPRRATRTTR